MFGSEVLRPRTVFLWHTYEFFLPFQKSDVYETDFIVYSAEKVFPFVFFCFESWLHHFYKFPELAIQSATVLTRSELAGNFSSYPYSSDEQPFGNEGKVKGKKMFAGHIVIHKFFNYVLLMITLSSVVPILGL